MPGSDEFAEFDTDEATFDAMMRAAEPAELVAGRHHVTVRVVTLPAGVQVSVGNATSAGSLPGRSHESARRLRSAYRQMPERLGVAG
jgi:hypothetical protein